MFRNYINMAWRSIMRNRMFSLVNISGLALAIAACLLIGLYVYHEWNYDRQSPHASQIWRVYNQTITDGKTVTQDANTHGILGPTLKADLPEVADYTRLFNHGEKEINVVLDAMPYKIQNVWMADPGFLRMFPQEFIAGDAETALNDPYSVIITQSIAEKLFPGVSPIGQVIKVPGGWFVGDYTINAVVADPPSNTHLKFNMLASYATRYAQGHIEDWSGYWDYNYFQLIPGADVKKVERQLKKYSDDHLKQAGISLFMQPFTDIHLRSSLTYEIEPNGDLTTIRALALIALIILVIAFINYINLTTAQSLLRAKEVGVRKVLGANRLHLIRQFLFEGGLISLVAIILAIIILWIALPFFQNFAGIQLVNYKGFNESFWLIVPLIWLLAIAGGCLYPAFVLSAFSPLVTLRGKLGLNGKNNLRRVLVIIQFVFSTILIVAVFVIVQQLKYMSHHDKGLSLDQVVAMKLPVMDWREDSLNRMRVSVLQQKISKLAEVSSVSGSNIVPGQGISTIAGTSGGVYWTRNPSAVTPETIYYYNAEPSFFSTYSIRFKAGAPFAAPDRRTAGQHVIINESLLNLLGFANAESAVGEELAYQSNQDFKMKIHGVVANFHIESSKEPVRPSFYFCAPLVTNGYLSIKTTSAEISGVLKKLQAIWKDLFPESVFEYLFIDDQFNHQYKAEKQLAYIVSGFTFFAIFIACIGLFGLVIITTGQRRKEIGIRKVLGASVVNIVTLLSKDYVKLVLIAMFIAIPIASIVLNKWLQNFAFRIEIEWWVFVLSGLIAAFISLLTVSSQSLQAARSNPVKNLRTE
ncbi:MAG: ABC transporter permease [Flavisolibacter sp.]|nr:ABC transporter permease [Flavisolibacter sp.]